MPHPRARDVAASTLVVGLGVLVFASCAKTERVADGPIALDATPKEVLFFVPVASAPRRDLCFEFATPSQSHAASRIHVALLRSDGGQEDFVPTQIDRRGESLLCFCSQTVPEAAAAGTPPTTAATYRGAVLWSETPVRLRQIRWWSGPR